MPSGERVDFFLSRRGSVAAVAQEVADILEEKGYKVRVQDYDIPYNASFVQAMHDAIVATRDLIVLFTADYLDSPHTRKEYTSFLADRQHSAEERRVIVLRCEDAPVRGLFADHVHQDLAGIHDPAERRARILAAVEGKSLATRPPPLPFAGVPPRFASFTGRQQELDAVDAILTGGRPGVLTQATGRAAVHGMGGVGKTSTAVEYAYRYRDLYAGVWWCPSETRFGLLSALAALAVQLGAVPADEADVEKAAKAGLRRLAERRQTVLLVFDNVTAPQDIADLLPSAGARVLLTSRFSDWGDWAEEVPLDVLPPEDAAAFLRDRAGRPGDPAAPGLAEALGYLPLALDHAAAFCRRSGMGFATYAAQAARMIGTLLRGTPYPRSVAATFDLALSALAGNAAAEATMAFLAFCAPERVPMTLLEGALDDEADRAMALLTLTELSLVRIDPFEDGMPAVSVHRLVQAVARTRASATGTDAAERIVRRLTAVYPGDGYSNPPSWPLSDVLTPHVLALCESDQAGAIGTAKQAELLDRTGSFFQGRGNYHPALPLFERALAIRETALGPAHPHTATSLNNLALLRQAQGDLAGALPLYERALAIHETALGPAHPDTAASLNNLAALRQTQGDFAGALPLFERALAIGEAALGSANPLTARFRSHFARWHLDAGDPASALAAGQEALAAHEAAMGATAGYTLDSARIVADALVALGRKAEADAIRARYGLDPAG